MEEEEEEKEEEVPSYRYATSEEVSLALSGRTELKS